MEKELIDLYEENEKLALKSSLFRRQCLIANEKRHAKMAKDLDSHINKGDSGTTTVERLIRNIKNIEDMMAEQKKEIIDIDVQYKRLITLLKERYPDELERVRSSLVRKLALRGELKTE